MAEDFTHQILRMVVGKICQPLGWHAMNSNAGDVLADVLRQYILTIAKTTTAYSCHDNRTEPNLVDLDRAFKDLGVSLPELAEFVQQVRSSPLEQKVPLFPSEQGSTHVHGTSESESTVRKKRRRGSVSSRSNSTSSVESEEEWEEIPAHLPPLPSLKRTEKDEDAESGIHPTGDTTEMDTSTPTPLTPHDPSHGLPQSRPRLFSSDVSEESGSRRSSISEPALHKDTREVGVANIFESAFQKQLVKYDTATTAERSEVVGKSGGELGDKQDVTVAKKPKLPSLRLMSTSSDAVVPSQQPPLSPLIRSPLRQGLPVLSPLRSTAVKASSPPTVTTPPAPLKSLTDSTRKDTVTVETRQAAQVQEDRPQLYQVPGSPQKVPLKEFHVSTERVPLPPARVSASPPVTPMSHDSEGVARDSEGESHDSEGESRDPKGVSHDQTIEERPASPLSEGMSPVSQDSDKVSHDVSHDSDKMSHDSGKESHDPSREPTPADVSPKQSPSALTDKEDSPAIEAETVEEENDERKVTSVEAISSDTLKSNQEKGGVVELESVLSQLSETESSECEEAVNDDKEEEAEPSIPDSRVSESSTHTTPTPLPSHPHTPTAEYSPVIPDQGYLSSPVHHEAEELELSEDNLSISAEGSDSDTEPEPPPDYTETVPESTEFVEGGTESPSCDESDTEHAQDYTTDLASTEEGVESVRETRVESPLGLSGDPGSDKQVMEQVTEIESSVLLPENLDGEVSIEVGGCHDDSSEMISTLSAQVPEEDEEDFTEITKVLEQDLSSDDFDEDEPVFKTAEESREAQNESLDASACVLTTSTEKVKGETTGRKRTVSKDDVLGINKPKKPSRKRRRKGGPRTQRVPSIGTVGPPPTVEAPLPTTLLVSIKKSLYEVPLTRPTTLVTTPSPRAAVGEPLVITISRRHLLRHPQFRLPSMTPEDKPKPTLDRLKIRLAKFGSSSALTPKSSRLEFEATPPSVPAVPLGSRKREREVSPVEFMKRPKVESQPPSPQGVGTPTASLSLSSSSSSSDNDDSDSPILTPPQPPLFTQQYTPSHLTTPSLLPPHTLSSEDDDSSSSSSSDSESGSGESGVGGGSVSSGVGGLTLTISKAVLKQAARPATTSVGGAGAWPSTKSGTAAPRARKPLAGPVAGKTKRKQPATKKQTKEPPKLLISDRPVVHTLPTITPTLPHTLTPSVGSDTICPVCEHKDDGSPMIGCDRCDDWCHWRCVGVYVAPPENEDWYCPNCREKARKKAKKKLKKSKR